jgi:hypothetical protein
MVRTLFLKLAAVAGLVAMTGAPGFAQVSTIDPNLALGQDQGPEPGWDYVDSEPVDPGPQTADPAPPPEEMVSPAPSASVRASEAAGGGTVPGRDVFSAAEGVFGKGAEGLADLIEDLLRDQGEPSAYITGREAGGAFIAGVRYGSGTLHHQIEGDRPIFWTGPSLGFDFGADANKVFVLVYNLHDSQRMFRRYPAAEGNAYLVGGFTASYLRRGDVVLIPVRMGVGMRLGLNAGYMRFSEKNRWLPF